jgi:hypothetical protein
MNKKLVLVLLLISSLVLSSACVKKSAGEPNKSEVWIKFQPMRCDRTPWEQWYLDGNIQFVQAPTDHQLIVSYYGQVHNVNVLNYSSVSLPPPEVECTDCSICPKMYYVNIAVPKSSAAKMLSLGWTKI